MRPVYENAGGRLGARGVPFPDRLEKVKLVEAFLRLKRGDETVAGAAPDEQPFQRKRKSASGAEDQQDDGLNPFHRQDSMTHLKPQSRRKPPPDTGSKSSRHKGPSELIPAAQSFTSRRENHNPGIAIEKDLSSFGIADVSSFSFGFRRMIC